MLFNHFRKHLLNEFPVSRMSSVVNLSKAVHRCGLGIAVSPFSTQTNAVHTKHFELGSSWKAASWAMGELARNFAKKLFGEERLPETQTSGNARVFSLQCFCPDSPMENNRKVFTDLQICTQCPLCQGCNMKQASPKNWRVNFPRWIFNIV